MEAHACQLLVRCVGEGETWSVLWVIVRLETLACTGDLSSLLNEEVEIAICC